jgi:chemotaxis protein MotB
MVPTATLLPRLTPPDALTMRRKKRPAEYPNHERWLVSYADFITLLFAFFVVMFAVSQVDSKKLGRFVESLNVAFEFRGPFPQTSQKSGAGGEKGLIGITTESAVPFGPIVKSPIDAARSKRLLWRREQAHQVRSRIERALAGTQFADKVRVGLTTRGIVVSLAEGGFFDPGSATVRRDSMDALKSVAMALRDEPGPVAVEGHTDNVPIHTAMFPSNWELSTARATTIVRYLIDDVRFDPKRLSATGFGEYRPEADNSTPEGRLRNRRVDLVLLLPNSGPALPPGGGAPPSNVATAADTGSIHPGAQVSARNAPRAGAPAGG